jgi:hypothetical protein
MKRLTKLIILLFISLIQPGKASAQLGSLSIDAIRKGMRVNMICFYQNENDASRLDTLRVASSALGSFQFFSAPPNIFPFSPLPHTLQREKTETMKPGEMYTLNQATLQPAFLNQEDNQGWRYLMGNEMSGFEVVLTGKEWANPADSLQMWNYQMTEGVNTWEVSYLPGCCFTRIALNGEAWNLIKVNRWDFSLDQPPKILENICPPPAPENTENEELEGE